ncbi:MAG: wax ester/triacylglycerol synthase family O-acyltransferase [Burkholderiaceae bacterium]|nr:wax ester/triacylglycerol synthase family O-acyltransferase [Burkholderiaceae bacterium]
MSAVDTAWLRMDSPVNLMMIVGVEIFDSPVSYEELSARLGERLLAYDRFRQCVVPEGDGYYWEEDERFSLARHVRKLKLRGKADDKALQKLVGRLASEPLDPQHPLWRFDLVENYRGGRAVIVRIHHCIADGIALVRVMLSMGDDPVVVPAGAPGAGARAAGTGDDARGDDRGESDRAHAAPASAGAFEPYIGQALRAAELVGGALGRTLEIASDGNAREAVATLAARVTLDALKIGLMTEDSPTSLKGRPQGVKAVAWNEPMPLAEVKAVCRVLGVSVNDILLSGVAGAVHRYLEDRGEDTHGKELRAMVPVNLRGADEPPSLGNRFGLVPLTLPIGIGNPIERVFEVRRRMSELKEGYQGPIAFAILNATGMAPRIVQKFVLDYLAHKGTAVMTNVPGPQQPIRIFGRRLERVMVWVPQSGDIGMGVSILSYDGNVQFGLITDTALCPQPHAIIDHFQPEFERLLLTLSLLPRELVEIGLDPREVEQRLFARSGAGAKKRPRKRARVAARGRVPG